MLKILWIIFLPNEPVDLFLLLQIFILFPRPFSMNKAIMQGQPIKLWNLFLYISEKVAMIAFFCFRFDLFDFGW